MQVLGKQRDLVTLADSVVGIGPTYWSTSRLRRFLDIAFKAFEVAATESAFAALKVGTRLLRETFVGLVQKSAEWCLDR